MTLEAFVEHHYPTVMNSIAGRLLASHQLLCLMEEQPKHECNWLRLDSVALQVRKVCELFLLGSTLAHLQEGSELDPKKWQPKDAFAELHKFNPNPLPLPLSTTLRVLPHGSKQFVPASKPIPIAVLTAVYGQCGNILHVPTASKILDEKVAPFDWNKYRRWVDGFSQLLAAHLLLLPNIKRVLICNWSGKAGDDPQISLAEGMGEAIFDDKELANFTLLVA